MSNTSIDEIFDGTILDTMPSAIELKSERQKVWHALTLVDHDRLNLLLDHASRTFNNHAQDCPR